MSNSSPDPAADVDGRISQGWGGVNPEGVHVNVTLARRGSPTAAALLGAFTCPGPGRTPVLVCVGVDQPSYETVYPPTIMVSKVAPATELLETLLFGAVQVGIARAVLDVAHHGLLAPTQDTIIFVSVWLHPEAQRREAVLEAAREAMLAAVTEAVSGRPPEAVRQLVAARDAVTHPFY